MWLVDVPFPLKSFRNISKFSKPTPTLVYSERKFSFLYTAFLSTQIIFANM